MKTRTLASVAGWLLVVTGVGHATLLAIGSATTPSAQEAAIREEMTARSVTLAGMERSQWELYLGFSLMMALMLVGLGALLLLVLRRAPELVEGSRAVLALMALVLVPASVISALLLPPPPILLLGAAAVAVLAGLVVRPGSTRVQRAIPADIFDM